MIKKTTLSILFLIVSLFVVKLFAQAAFRGTPTKNYNDNLLLHAMLTEYAVFNINSAALKQYVSSNEFTKFSLNLVNTKNWDINLFANDIRSEQYKLIIGDAEGDHILPKGENITYKGYTNDNQEVRMTINDNFIVAYVFGDKEAYYIEPLQRFIAEAPNDTYIFYNVAHIIPDANMKCGVVETIERQKQVQAQIQAQANERSIVPQGCVNVNLAIASLYDMYTAFSSNTTNVTNQTIAVTNNVITDYDNDFSKVINYTIVANYVSTSASSALDAAITSSDNGNMMLCNFSNWASTGGFGVAHDLGSLWTDRNFASGTNYSTVGLAYVGGVCTPYSYNLTTTNNECSVNVSNVSVRYNLLEDFTTTMSNLRNMVSHEYGHNWGCSHDAAGSTTIMAPSVNGSVTWSSTSISSVNTQEASTNCNFGTTALVGTPNVLFNVPNGVCINQSVSLLGTSGRTVTSWAWAMPGGNPTSAATQNTSVSYSSTGSKTVTLTGTATSCSGAASSPYVRTINVINNTAPAAACSITTSNSNTASNFGLGIGNVIFGTINATSGSTFADGTIYKDFTCENYTTLTTLSNSISVSVTSSTYVEGIRVYIDINNNGTFETTESFFTSAAKIGTHTGTITLPNTGVTTDRILRMRILSDFSAVPANGCVTPSYGQVEDYGVIVPAALVLPVKLLDFSVEEKDGTVDVKWVTTAEENNRGFEVERSIDGKNFRSLGFVAAKKVAQDIQNRYYFKDEHPMSGLSYYRLKQIDNDGSENYYGLEAVRIKTKNYVIVQPNPTHTNATAIYNNETEQKSVSVALIDLTGKIVWGRTISVEKGMNNIPLEFETLPKGIYVLQMKMSDVAEYVKVVYTN